MAEGKQRIELTGPLEVGLPDGSVVSIRPGPYGKGISVVPQGEASEPSRPRSRAEGQGRGRGRPPNESTVELRATLEKDKAGSGLKEASHYIDWLTAREPKATRARVQQTVYRELRAVGGGTRRSRAAGKRVARKAKGGDGPGARGRVPHPATLLLREKLAKDAGTYLDPAAYIRWLVDKANIGIRQARPIVYRELRLAKNA